MKFQFISVLIFPFIDVLKYINLFLRNMLLKPAQFFSRKQFYGVDQLVFYGYILLLRGSIFNTIRKRYYHVYWCENRIMMVKLTVYFMGVCLLQKELEECHNRAFLILVALALKITQSTFSCSETTKNKSILMKYN